MHSFILVNNTNNNTYKVTSVITRCAVGGNRRYRKELV